MKKPKYFKLSDEAINALNNLEQQTSINQTKLVEKSIIAMWKDPQTLYQVFPGDITNLQTKLSTIKKTKK